MYYYPQKLGLLMYIERHNDILQTDVWRCFSHGKINKNDKNGKSCIQRNC